MKKLLFTLIILFFFPFTAKAAVEFVSVVDTGGASDSDYSSLSTWETGLGTNLTAPSTLVFSGVITGTAPIDNSSVTLYRSGSPVGVGATVVHTAKTGTQILLENVTNPSYGFTTGDEWRIDASNLFTIDATTPDQPQVTAKCRATTGAADTTYVTISGWDTDATHFIKIWTDPAENYRHQGKYDISKYRMEVTTNNYPIYIAEEYAKMDGLQISLSNSNNNNLLAVRITPSGASEIQVSNNIVQGILSGSITGNSGISVSGSENQITKIYNNIAYGFSLNATGAGITILAGTAYVYNNTVVNNYRGISSGAGTNIAKNNLSYNNTDNYYIAPSAGSTNNLSGPSSDDQLASTSAPQNGVTVTFADVYNNDFHLDSSDTGAKNNGTILYDSGDDSNLNFTTDIDNEARKDVAGTWDIGADENVAKIYRSVGAGATSPLASGGTADSSYGNMTISGLIATFWRPLPDNVGVGDALQYDADNTEGVDNIAFITKRIDSTHYSIRKSDGTAPTATSSVPNSTWSIYRSYISLSNAEAGTENTGITSGVRDFDTGNVNLTTNNLQWNIACFANGTVPDTTAVTINDWTTTADNYIRIYTPTRTDEVGTTQRHTGKLDTSKYYLSVSNDAALESWDDYTRIDGLQITKSSSNADNQGVINVSADEVKISNCILKQAGNNSYNEPGIITSGDINVSIWNTIIYGLGTKTSSDNSGIVIWSGAGDIKVYNSTVIGGYKGFYTWTASNRTAKNCYASSNGGAAYDGFTLTTSASSDTSGTVGLQNIVYSTANFTNVTSGSEDLHLAVGSTLKNVGTDLTNDSVIPLNTDIDSSGSIDGKSCDAVYQDQCLTRPRSTSWDIGADELITKIYRSVGVGTTAAIISGTSSVISLTISGNTGTFATWPTSADFGVGDVIRYDSDNNGTLDSTAFISAIDSTNKTATLQNSTGGAPTAMAVGDYDWKLFRAHTSLSDWEAGTANTGIGVTFPGGNRDIATNSEQWNVACYANSGTAPDTTGVTISGWTTAQQNYIKVYTPTVSTEVTTSQRHQGKWDSNKYLISVGSGQVITIQNDFVWIDGIQGDFTGANIGIYSHIDSGATQLKVSNSIIKGGNMGVTSQHNNDKFYIWNNIFYSISSGIYALSPSSWIYNNTFASNANAFNYGGGYTLKNNLFYGNTNDIYNCSAFNGTSDYNATDKASIATGGTYDKVSQTFSFIDSTNKDFHLNSSDTAAKNAGADLSQDLYLPLSSDLDGQTRISNFQLPISNQIPSPNSQFDIGADQSANAIYRSLAPSATSSIASGTSLANSMIIAGTSVTFGTAPGDTIGVGDAIQYDSDNNGTVDSIAFITYRTDSTHYKIQDRTGGTPTSTSATDYDWSIFRAYTALNNAVGSSGGTESTGLADAIEHFDIGWSAAHGKDIYKYNQQWNVAAYANSTNVDTTYTYINGWTSYPTNYIKIYTPYLTTEVGTSQRHQGKWDDSKYNIYPSSDGNTIYFTTSYTWIDGLQVKLVNNSVGYRGGIIIFSDAKSARISNCIVKETNTSSSYRRGISAWSTTYGPHYIWNNIIYGFSGTDGAGIVNSVGYGTKKTYVYNNTITNSARGIFSDSGNLTVAKNNITQNCANGYDGSFDASSDYNISSVASDQPASGAHDKTGTTVTFSDSANYDFHLGIGDTAARNSGADLSADAYLPVTGDIDGHTRPTGSNVVDIGADEGATAIYYSVGQSTSTDFKVASNVTVTGYTATFTTSQTGNIGVGDIVTYTGGSCYITGKTSTTVWNCQNATGGTAPQVTGVSVTSIKRAFASLNSSIGGSTAPEFLNTSDLKANNYQLNIPCYMDSGTTPDTTAVTIQGYTTAVPNYIKVYTPNNTTTEANNSQRHQGKWDDGKYKISLNGWEGYAIGILATYVRVEGIQISNTSGGQTSAISVNSGTYNSNEQISNNIIKGPRISNGIAIADYTYAKVFNNIVYDTNQYAIYVNSWAYSNNYVYNNTVYNSTYGLRNYGTANFIAKNNLVVGSGDANAYVGTFATGTDYNATDGTDAIGQGSNNRISQAVTFTDSTNSDFHLGIGDTGAQNVGLNIGTGSTEPYNSFTTDIDGNTRNLNSRGWDIGADEAATAIYYSVGQSSSDLKTGSPTLSIDAAGAGTLSVAQTGNMGVGDYIEYGTSPYNKAYISGKTSSTVWTVQSATGSMLGVATTEPVSSIKHSYTTLSGAIAGASGATMMNTTDLYTNNYQLNVPCYYDNAADTTAVSISGYTTYSKNYIKVYTPTNTTTEANNSQRHSGKWDEGKYRFEVSTYSYGNALSILTSYVTIEGLQFKTSTSAAGLGVNTISLAVNSVNDTGVYVRNNILTQGSLYSESSDVVRGICYGSFSYYSKAYIYNNIIYGFKSQGIRQDGPNRVWYINNNTIYGCGIGISKGAEGIQVAKNNIVYNNATDYSGYFISASVNNLSKDATSPNSGSTDCGGHSCRNQLVSFIDENNKDFHLLENDTSARNAGADLSADTNIAVTNDIDGNTRPTQGIFDIGADEGSTYIYYSVGQNTNDHKTGSPTITLSGYAANLSVAQTAPNMGVGDLITYTGGSCYITSKTNDDKMHWNCQNATGGTAPQVTTQSVTSIAHAFSSLDSAVRSSVANGAHDSSHLNTADIYSGNYILNVPCYYDDGADTSRVIIPSNWITAANNYIRIYTPYNTSNEINQSQRHSGKWDDQKYRIEYTTSSDGYVIQTSPKYVNIEGLQIKISNSDVVSSYGIMISTSSINSAVKISDNIIKAGTVQSGSYSLSGISFSGSRSAVLYIWNNIFYDFTNGSTGRAMLIGPDTGYVSNVYLYNNTIYNSYIGIFLGSNANVVAKNNIVQGTTNGYYGSFASGSDYNISNVSSDTTGGAYDKDNTTVTFADSANNNFHLSANDTAAVGTGTDLSADAYLPFSTDIDGQDRGGWCIGADEFVDIMNRTKGTVRTKGNVRFK